MEEPREVPADSDRAAELASLRAAELDDVGRALAEAGASTKASRPIPRIQVLALPPERTHDAEANPFILVFDRVGGDTDLRRDMLAAREGLEIGTGARAVMIFGDEVEVVTGFEVDDALAAKVRAVLDRRTA